MPNTRVQRLLLVLLIGVGLFIGAGHQQRLFAQELAPADLSARALAVDDLTGYRQVSETTMLDDMTFAPLFVRTFVSDTAYLFVALGQPRTSVPDQLLQTVVGTGLVFNVQKTASNVLITGPNGIGDLDQSAIWNTPGDNGAQNIVYGESFLQGRLLAFMLYVPLATAVIDSDQAAAQAAQYARLQQAKLVATNP